MQVLHIVVQLSFYVLLCENYKCFIFLWKFFFIFQSKEWNICLCPINVHPFWMVDISTWSHCELARSASGRGEIMMDQF